MIYFIQHTNFIKIGYTDNILKRLSQLQVSCPVKLEVLGLIEGDYIIEKDYHLKFKEFSCNGEWFVMDKIILDYIDSLPKDLMWKHGFIVGCEKHIIGSLKTARINKNMSLEEVGELLGITKQGVQDMELREAQGRVTLNSMHNFSKAVGCKFEYRVIPF